MLRCLPVILFFSFFSKSALAESVGRWLVKLRSPEELCVDQWWNEKNFHEESYFLKHLPLEGWLVVQIPEGEVLVLKKLECVASVMKDMPIEWRNTVPNDPIYINQGDMNLIGMPKAWDISTGGLTYRGDTIVVAVVDNGYDIQHGDLIANIWKNKGEIPNDHIDNDNNGYTDDYRGLNLGTGDDKHSKEEHGTQVAGIIGAKGNNGQGVSGINWNVKIMLISGAGQESQVIEAYQYALEMRQKYNQTHGAEGAFVVATNLSGGIDNEFAADHPAWCEMYDKLGQAGILSVASGPNKSINVDVDGDMPTTCSSPYFIGVTNVDLSDFIVESAGFGPTSIDLGAPGEGTFTINLNNQYKDFSGTSAASPHVAGTIGLLYSVPCEAFLSNVDDNPSGTALNMKDIILSSAKSINSLQDITLTGKRLQADAAMRAAMDQCTHPVTPVLKITSIGPNPVRLENARVRFVVQEQPEVASLSIYTDSGALVRSIDLSEGDISQGYYDINTSSLAAAIYLVTLRSGKEKSTAKLFVY